MYKNLIKIRKLQKKYVYNIKILRETWLNRIVNMSYQVIKAI